MKKTCDHPSLFIVRMTNDILEGMEGILDFANVTTVEDLTKSIARMIQGDNSRGVPFCKIAPFYGLVGKCFHSYNSTTFELQLSDWHPLLSFKSFIYH